MKIIYSPRFRKEYHRLSYLLKEKAANREDIFRKNPFDSSLKTHKLSGRLSGLWAFSIDYNYRIIFEFNDKSIVIFHSIGGHSIYL